MFRDTFIKFRWVNILKKKLEIEIKLLKTKIDSQSIHRVD